MPPSVRSLRYTQKILDFSGGLNSQIPSTEIADNQLTTALNFHYINGQLCKRPGFSKISTSSIGSNSGLLGYDSINDRILFAPTTTLKTIANSSVYNIQTVTGATEAWTWTLTALGSTYVGSTASLRTLATSTTLSAAITNAPGSVAGVWHKNRLFVAQNTPKNRLAFSDPATPTTPSPTWQTTSVIDIGYDSTHDPIASLASVGDLLIIFKQYSIWTLYVQGLSSADWVLKQISNIYGCFGPSGNKTSVVVNTEAYFMCNRGLFKTNGSSFVELSQNIWNQMQAIFYDLGVGSSIWNVLSWNDNIIINFNTPYGYQCYVYNIPNQAWTQWNFLGNSGFGDIISLPTDRFGYLFAVGGAGPNFYATAMQFADYSQYAANLALLGYSPFQDGALFGTGVGGSAYTAQFTTKEFSSFVDWYWRIKWASLEYIALGSPTFNMIHDGTAGATVNPGFASTRKGYKMYGAGRCRLFQINCIHALITPFEFYRGNVHFALKRGITASGAP